MKTAVIGGSAGPVVQRLEMRPLVVADQNDAGLLHPRRHLPIHGINGGMHYPQDGALQDALGLQVVAPLLPRPVDDDVVLLEGLPVGVVGLLLAPLARRPGVVHVAALAVAAVGGVQAHAVAEFGQATRGVVRYCFQPRVSSWRAFEYLRANHANAKSHEIPLSFESGFVCPRRHPRKPPETTPQADHSPIHQAPSACPPQ